jgi:hypothetical protein
MVTHTFSIAVFAAALFIVGAIALAFSFQPVFLGLTFNGIDLLPNDPGQFVAGITFNGLD